jgi:psp operon transcriptional activator
MALIAQQPIGESESFHALMDRVSDVAALENAALLTGERGTGKELIASRLHFLSPRWEQVYVSLNCAAYDDEALDRELCGEVFYDSRPDQLGAFERANGGTLFLDHVDDCSPRLQEKLLSILEHGQIRPIGSQEEAQSIDVRLVSATSIDLPAAAARGEFRADLIDRIAFDVISLPPLRARPEDFAPLIAHFGRKMAAKLGAARFPGLTPEASAHLMRQAWPGNVRELKLAVERSVAKAFLADEALSLPIDDLVLDPFAGPYRLTHAPIAAQVQGQDHAKISGPATTAMHPAQNRAEAEPQAALDFAGRVMIFERGLIDEAMSFARGHQGRASEYLGLTYHQFRGLLRKHGLKK